MKHSVEIKVNGNTVATYENCTKRESIKAAKKESNDNNQIFISGYNGQCTVYLNPNGNYEITGKSW
jgi:hypothetical protein